MKLFHALLSIALAFSATNVASSAAQGDLDKTFNCDVEGDAVLSLLVQPDRKAIIAGNFPSVGGVARSYIARINPDGTLDPSFTPDVNKAVRKMALQPDGKILIAGIFTAVGGEARNNIARLNADGTLDKSFKVDVSIDAKGPAISGIALQPQGRILIGGRFVMVGGMARKNLARINSDGSLDPAFQLDADGNIWSMSSQTDGKVVIGGMFKQVGDAPRNLLIRLNANGTQDSSFNPALSGAQFYGVMHTATQTDGKIVIAGDFTQVGGEKRNHLVRLNPDGKLDMGFTHTSGTFGFPIALQADGKIIRGGSSTTTTGDARNGMTRLNPDGTIDTGFNSDSNGEITCMVVQADGKLLVGGRFTTIAGVPRKHLARFNTGK